jgi:hypothetical protein
MSLWSLSDIAEGDEIFYRYGKEAPDNAAPGEEILSQSWFDEMFHSLPCNDMFFDE